MLFWDELDPPRTRPTLTSTWTTTTAPRRSPRLDVLRARVDWRDRQVENWKVRLGRRQRSWAKFFPRWNVIVSTTWGRNRECKVNREVDQTEYVKKDLPYLFISSHFNGANSRSLNKLFLNIKLCEIDKHKLPNLEQCIQYNNKNVKVFRERVINVSNIDEAFLISYWIQETIVDSLNVLLLECLQRRETEVPS